MTWHKVSHLCIALSRMLRWLKFNSFPSMLINDTVLNWLRDVDFSSIFLYDLYYISHFGPGVDPHWCAFNIDHDSLPFCTRLFFWGLWIKQLLQLSELVPYVGTTMNFLDFLLLLLLGVFQIFYHHQVFFLQTHMGYWYFFPFS